MTIFYLVNINSKYSFIIDNEFYETITEILKKWKKRSFGSIFKIKLICYLKFILLALYWNHLLIRNTSFNKDIEFLICHSQTLGDVFFQIELRHLKVDAIKELLSESITRKNSFTMFYKIICWKNCLFNTSVKLKIKHFLVNAL